MRNWRETQIIFRFRAIELMRTYVTYVTYVFLSDVAVTSLNHNQKS